MPKYTTVEYVCNRCSKLSKDIIGWLIIDDKYICKDCVKKDAAEMLNQQMGSNIENKLDLILRQLKTIRYSLDTIEAIVEYLSSRKNKEIELK